MTGSDAGNRTEWISAKEDLCRAVRSLGFPGEFGDLIAKQLGSPRSMNRMASYLRNVRPRSVEMIADEMLAIAAEAETWRRKKESEEAQAGYTAWLNRPREDGDE